LPETPPRRLKNCHDYRKNHHGGWEIATVVRKTATIARHFAAVAEKPQRVPEKLPRRQKKSHEWQKFC